MTREFIAAALMLGLILIVLWKLCNWLYGILIELKTTQKQLNGSRLLATKFDQAAKLIGDLDSLQAQITQCNLELNDSVSYVKKLRTEFRADHRNTKQELAGLGKLKFELQAIATSLHGDRAQLLKILKTHDINLSRRATFGYDDEDDSDGPAPKLLPSDF